MTVTITIYTITKRFPTGSYAFIWIEKVSSLALKSKCASTHFTEWQHPLSRLKQQCHTSVYVKQYKFFLWTVKLQKSLSKWYKCQQQKSKKTRTAFESVLLCLKWFTCFCATIYIICHYHLDIITPLFCLFLFCENLPWECTHIIWNENQSDCKLSMKMSSHSTEMIKNVASVSPLLVLNVKAAYIRLIAPFCPIKDVTSPPLLKSGVILVACQ